MNKELEKILDVCLEEMKRGKSIEDCLETYPQHKEELESLLRMAMTVEEIPAPEPRTEAIDAMLIRMGEAIVERSEKRPLVERVFGRPFIGRPAVVKVLASVLVVVIAVWSMGMVSSRSIPGDMLYPIKTASEKVRFVLTRSTEGKVELRLVYADRRLEELIKVVGRRGQLDESVLRALLRETEQVLDEAQTIDERRFLLLLAQLDHFNNCTKDVLEQIKPHLSEHECGVIDNALKVCHKRSQHMMKMRDRNGKRTGERKWNSGCRWR
jgi:hypothetical protein